MFISKPMYLLFQNAWESNRPDEFVEYIHLAIPPGADLENPIEDAAFMKKIGAKRCVDDDDWSNSAEWDDDDSTNDGEVEVIPPGVDDDDDLSNDSHVLVDDDDLVEYTMRNSVTGRLFTFEWHKGHGTDPSYWRLEHEIYDD